MVCGFVCMGSYCQTRVLLPSKVTCGVAKGLGHTKMVPRSTYP